MGCGCRKNKSTSDSRVIAADSASRLTYEVWRQGSYTGRSFTSLVTATAYARRVGGEVIAK
jgi:hypothetical protein